jgi:hypothetical protein
MQGVLSVTDVYLRQIASIVGVSFGSAQSALSLTHEQVVCKMLAQNVDSTPEACHIEYFKDTIESFPD